MSKFAVLLIVLASGLASGCASSPRPLPSQIPESALRQCALPDLTRVVTVGDMELALAQAMACAAQCNADRQDLQQ